MKNSGIHDILLFSAQRNPQNNSRFYYYILLSISLFSFSSPLTNNRGVGKGTKQYHIQAEEFKQSEHDRYADTHGCSSRERRRNQPPPGQRKLQGSCSTRLAHVPACVFCIRLPFICQQGTYVTSTKKQKLEIIKSIVDHVKTKLEPPGRFLEKNRGTKLWQEVDEKHALEKTAQALRDGGSLIRKQLCEGILDPEILADALLN
ncbi:hypothetical protein ACHAWF_000489 [Thalassiosira exigua]